MTNSLSEQSLFMYVGSYTSKDSTGISVFRFNQQTGEVQYVDGGSSVPNPSYLTIDTQKRCLYAVSETMECEGQPGGAVASYAIDPSSGKLSYINKQLTAGGAPCYVSIDPTGSYLLVANYADGIVSMLPIEEGGRIGERVDTIKHKGSQPHAHSISPDPSQRYIIAADLGIDKLIQYKLDMAERKLIPYGEVIIHSGAGPRHFDFHPDGNFVYVINELDSTTSVFAYEAKDASMRHLQTITTLPLEYDGRNSCADIHVSACGKYVYGSNRGHNSIVVYEVDKQGGSLTVIEHISTLGKTPRNFALSPNGHYLLAANQDSDQIVIFAIDRNTGRLQPTGRMIEVSQPVCIKFAFSEI